MACKCGSEACAFRMCRNLRAFCEMPPPAQEPKIGFRSYEAAAAERKPGQKIRSCRSGLDGCPRRFVLVG